MAGAEEPCSLEALSLTPGTRFERYDIEALVGRGGMGEVYRATDSRLHRPVALKVMRTDHDAALAVSEAGGTARLLREARAAAALNHPNSVAIYELGEHEGIFYIAMEFVQGAALRRYVKDPNVTIDTKVSWLVDAARALWAAHKAGLVHRDVKPGNIMVSEEGIVKVLDFGLAKVTAASAAPAGFSTQMGQVLGTPRYMAPEQLEGHPADASADQFSFGITAYEVISGVFPGGPLAGSVTPLDQAMPGAARELARVVARMMSRKPEDRFATMEEAAHALRGCIGIVTRPRVDATIDDLDPNATIDDLKPYKDPPKPHALERSSDRPTEVRSPEVEAPSHAQPVHVQADRVLATNATLPLAQPMRLAMGAPPTALGPPGQSAREGMNRTIPLARPLDLGAPPPPPAPSARVPEATSGVFPSRLPSGDRNKQTDPRAPRLLPQEPISTSTPVRGPAPWMIVAVFVAVAALTGAVGAWLLR